MKMKPWYLCVRWYLLIAWLLCNLFPIVREDLMWNGLHLVSLLPIFIFGNWEIDRDVRKRR